MSTCLIAYSFVYLSTINRRGVRLSVYIIGVSVFSDHSMLSSCVRSKILNYESGLEDSMYQLVNTNSERFMAVSFLLYMACYIYYRTECIKRHVNYRHGHDTTIDNYI